MTMGNGIPILIDRGSGDAAAEGKAPGAAED